MEVFADMMQIFATNRTAKEQEQDVAFLWKDKHFNQRQKEMEA